MQTCPFCKASLGDSSTFCKVCGYSLLLPLPQPVLTHRKLYYLLCALSILTGSVSCAFTFIPQLYMTSLFFFMAAIGLAGVILERTTGKSQTLLIKILAVLGLALGVLGYISFMFIRSNVPGCGYTM
jgi:hypothetical protein